MSERGDGYSVFHEENGLLLFAESADAEKFVAKFGGEKFDPKQRGRGANWA